MTETSYTAWDDKLYQWPPPDGWYEAGDGKWWPEGYGPGTVSSDADATVADTGGATINGQADQFGETGESGDAGDVFADLSVADSADSTTSGWAASVAKSAKPFDDALPSSFGDAADAATSRFASDATDAASDFGLDAVGESAVGDGGIGERALGGVTDAADAGLGALGDAAGGFTLPGSEDVGAALAETMSARADDAVDTASSGLGGLAGDLGDAVATSDGVAGAVSEASEFATADLPQRPKTDLDALPPPSFDPPSFDPPSFDPPTSDGGPSVAESADNLTDLADPPAGFPTQAIDPASGSGSGSLFGLGADGGPSPSIGGLDPAVESAMPSASSGFGGPDSLDFPSPGAASAPLADLGQPDATLMGSMPGSDLGQPDMLTNPAETGQFTPPAADADPWSTPPPGQFGAAPPQGAPPMGAPGSMPWGQPGAPGGPTVPGGLDQAVLQAEGGQGPSRALLLLVGLGVVALVLLGVAGYLIFGGGDDDGDSAAAATGPGSLAEPHTRTTPVEVFYPDGDIEQRFIIEVLEPVRDASTAALEAPPAAGQRFAVTRVRVTNQTSADAPVGDLRFNAVTQAGTVLDREDNSCTITEPSLDFGITLGQAGVAEGVVCWVVSDADFPGLLLGIESTQVSGRIHIDLQ